MVPISAINFSYFSGLLNSKTDAWIKIDLNWVGGGTNRLFKINSYYSCNILSSSLESRYIDLISLQPWAWVKRARVSLVSFLYLPFSGVIAAPLHLVSPVSLTRVSSTPSLIKILKSSEIFIQRHLYNFLSNLLQWPDSTRTMLDFCSKIRKDYRRSHRLTDSHFQMPTEMTVQFQHVVLLLFSR